MFQSRLRTRRYVGFLRCCEYPWTVFGCNQIFRGWGTCRNMRRQVHRCRVRFCPTSFFSFLFLHTLRHTNEEHCLIHHVWNYFWSICLRVHVWCQCIESVFFKSRLVLLNKQSKATRWVLETCLIVGLGPFIIILITAWLSSKTYNIALEPECVPLDGPWSMCWSDRHWYSWLELVFACVIEELPTSFSLTLLHLWFCWFGSVKNENFNHKMPKIESGNAIHV